ncbi:MAG TPA: DNA polymerase III subunit gamma/tau [Agromyces sp.]|nr:DNA polymerase III subunit gamma/tau [Agromyces sp.]
MPRDPDDDALRWEGDDDPTLAPGWKAVGRPVPVDGSTDDVQTDGPVRAAGTAETDVDTIEDADAARQPGSTELVVLGVLGGVYLLYAIGWLIAATTAPPQLADPLAQFMYSLGRWLAAAAPVLWFATVFWLAAGHRQARLLWLIAGAVLLVPLPFLLRG